MTDWLEVFKMRGDGLTREPDPCPFCGGLSQSLHLHDADGIEIGPEAMWHGDECGPPWEEPPLDVARSWARNEADGTVCSCQVYCRCGAGIGSGWMKGERAKDIIRAAVRKWNTRLPAMWRPSP